jgi:alpha-1,3-rhamnosyl/mannosyltransferase
MPKTKKLRILFDANPLMTQRTGVGHYTARLVENLAAEGKDDTELIGFYYNFFGRKIPPSSPRAKNLHYRPILFLPGPFVNLLRRFGIEIPVELLALTRADFVLFPNFLSHPSLFKTPSAPVIHDIAFLDFPQFGSDKAVRDLTRFVPKTLKRSKFVITVSEFSKRRISETYNVPSDSIITTFIPPQPQQDTQAERRTQLLDALSITKPYVFFMGTLEPRKNIVSLLDAYTLLSEDARHKYSLVLAGKLDWKYQDTKAKLESLQASGYDIHYLGYVDDEQQAALYQGASLFVLPSRYEGFGMQILETLSYGVPCAVSDIPVFHEVGGDAVTYFDQNDPVAIASAIDKSLNSPHDAEMLRDYVKGRPGWSEVSRNVLEHIRQACGKDKV